MRSPAMKTTTETPPSNDTEIDDLALLLWEQAGCPAGRQREFWLKAEDEIVNRGNPPPDKHSTDA
jgi:hypothetical protein